MSGGHYILRGREAVRVELGVWARWFSEHYTDRHVAKLRWGPLYVSTVFLGLDHQWRDGGEPHIFETMVFWGGWRDLYCARYSTWAEAEAGHRRAVRQVPLILLREVWRRVCDDAVFYWRWLHAAVKRM